MIFTAPACRRVPLSCQMGGTSRIADLGGLLASLAQSSSGRLLNSIGQGTLALIGGVQVDHRDGTSATLDADRPRQDLGTYQEGGGRIGSRQPNWSLVRRSSHEAGVLRHRRSGDQHIDFVQLQRSVRPAPNCDWPARSSRRPRDAFSTAETSAIARRGSRPQRDGPTVHRRHRQEWPVRTVIAGRHLPADWAQSPSLRRDVQRLTVSPSDHAQAAAQHLGSLLDLVKLDAAVNRRLTADRR